MALLLLGGLALGTSGCAGSTADNSRYPDRFVSAADESPVFERELFEGHPPAALGFVELMRGLPQDPQWRDSVRAVYADELYFSDTLAQLTTVDALIDHLAGVQSNAETLEVTVHDVVSSERGTYLRWQMVSTFRVLGRPVESRTIGVSMLRFDDDGRINFQQDFWDSAEGFYQHVPILGSVIRGIGGRF